MQNGPEPIHPLIQWLVEDISVGVKRAESESKRIITLECDPKKKESEMNTLYNFWKSMFCSLSKGCRVNVGIISEFEGGGVSENNFSVKESVLEQSLSNVIQKILSRK